MRIRRTAWCIDFFHNILSSSRLLLRSSLLILFGVTTRLKMACLHDPESCLLGEVASSGLGLGLLPTLRKLKIKLSYIKSKLSFLNTTYISNMGDFGGLSTIVRFLTTGVLVTSLGAELFSCKSLCEPAVEDLDIDPSESDSFGEFS